MDGTPAASAENALREKKAPKKIIKMSVVATTPRLQKFNSMNVDYYVYILPRCRV
jgi:hypothetical protein